MVVTDNKKRRADSSQNLAQARTSGKQAKLIYLNVYSAPSTAPGMFTSYTNCLFVPGR